MNRLFERIKKAEMDPRRFTRSDLNTQEFVVTDYCRNFHKLELDNSGITFTIAAKWASGIRRYNYKSLNCTFGEEGPKPLSANSWHDWSPNFVEVENGFADWLDSVAKEYFQYLSEEEEDQAAADFWAELDLPSADMSLLENTPFSEDEKTRIRDALGHYLKEVESRSLLSQDALKLLHERVEYSIDASKRLSRKDWIMATTGALIGFVFQIGLSPSVASELLKLSADALGWLWTMSPHLLPP